LYSISTGASSKVYAVAGLILASYGTAGSAAGRLGAPLNDEYSVNGRRRQDFEGGSIDYAPGDAVARISENPRQPVVTASPASVVAGGRMRLAAGGFKNDATVRVSITGQPDFVVTVPSGAYVWDVLVAANTKSGPVAIRAVDVNDASMSAQGSYTVRAVTDVRLQFTAISGDDQAGASGALLPLPLRVALTDETGNPIAGAAVQFTASPGGHIELASTATDASGQASAMLRLPASQGLALATVVAAGQIVTFSAKAGPVSLENFPKLTQAVDGNIGASGASIAQKGAMLAAAAGIMRYHQLRSEMPSPNGLADPVAINAFLKSDGYLSPGTGNDPIVNLWQLGGFVGNVLDVSVETPLVDRVRDLAAQGSPVMLGLALSMASSPIGSHFVVATGVAADGSILIADPNPAFARVNLNEYLAGFTGPGGKVQGTLTAAVRLLPRAPKTAGFLIAVDDSVEISSPAGACGTSMQFPGRAAVGPVADARGSFSTVTLRACTGDLAAYELDLGSGTYAGSLIDLGNANRVDLSGSGPSAFKVNRTGSQWTISPLSLGIAPSGVVNGASFTPDLAPGGIASIFGTGFGRAVSVQVNGIAAKVLASFPFQVNAQIPPDTIPGPAVLRISSEFGSADRSVTILPAGPEVFLIAPNQSAVVNQDGQLNTPSNPARRGQVIVVYGTGLGAVHSKGDLMVADIPVTALIEGQEIPVAFAGLTPGFVGLYQMNLNIPLDLPPGMGLRLSVRQGNFTSQTVQVAIQ
jgi:uncharacterized protein (TIGR03437 family)